MIFQHIGGGREKKKKGEGKGKLKKEGADRSWREGKLKREGQTGKPCPWGGAREEGLGKKVSRGE